MITTTTSRRCQWLSAQFQVVTTVQETLNLPIDAAFLTCHASTHAEGGGISNHNSSARPLPLERPKLQAGCPRADWEGFSAKWRQPNAATDKIIHQLLGCLDHDLSALVYNERAAPETWDLKASGMYILLIRTYYFLLIIVFFCRYIFSFYTTRI